MGPSNQRGQASSEYLLLVLGVGMAVALISYGIDGDVLKQMSRALSENLLVLTTILNLPI